MWTNIRYQSNDGSKRGERVSRTPEIQQFYNKLRESPVEAIFRILLHERRPRKLHTPPKRTAEGVATILNPGYAQAFLSPPQHDRFVQVSAARPGQCHFAKHPAFPALNCPISKFQTVITI